MTKMSIFTNCKKYQNPTLVHLEEIVVNDKLFSGKDMLMWHYVRVLTYSTKALHVRHSQNHKQKIHHLVRLKQENLDMREELAKVNLELNKQKRLVVRLKEHKSMSKENLPSSVLNTPATLNKTPAIRRQTIASPLANRNRNGQR